MSPRPQRIAHLFQGNLNGEISFRVFLGGGVVHEKYLWIPNEGTGDGNPLRLASRQAVAFLAHQGVVLLGSEKFVPVTGHSGYYQ